MWACGGLSTLESVEAGHPSCLCCGTVGGNKENLQHEVKCLESEKNTPQQRFQTFLLSQALITFHVLQALLSDINIKPLGLLLPNQRDHIHSGFPATFETPCFNGFYRITIFYLPLNKYRHHPGRLHSTGESVCTDMQNSNWPGVWAKRRRQTIREKDSTVNCWCSWPTGGVDGMVGSALLSINETRQSPAVQLQQAQTPSQLIATRDDLKECVIVWKQPEKKKRLKET